MIKVAIVYHYLAHYRLPIFKELMKSEEVEYTLFSGISSEIEIKTIDQALADISIADGGLRWKFFNNQWILRKKILWQNGLIKLALKSDFDAFIFLGSPYHISTWFGAMIARMRGKKVYFWMHGVYKDKFGFIDYIKLYVFYKIANGYFLYGNRAAEILKKYKIKPRDKINVVYNSLDYEKCLAYRKKLNEEDLLIFRKSFFNNISLPVVSFIGRLNYTKKIHLLIEAQKKLKDKYGTTLFNVILIGDGEEKNNLLDLVKIYGLEENVYFSGAIYDEMKIADILNNTDLCVTPGEVGLTAIHSMSYGTPVISHNNFNLQMPEVEVIKSKETGDFFKYNDIADLVHVLENWFKLYPIKTELISDNCKKLIDKFYNPYHQVSVFNLALKK